MISSKVKNESFSDKSIVKNQNQNSEDLCVIFLPYKIAIYLLMLTSPTEKSETFEKIILILRSWTYEYDESICEVMVKLGSIFKCLPEKLHCSSGNKTQLICRWRDKYQETDWTMM